MIVTDTAEKSPINCRVCGSSVKPGAKRCSKCGTEASKITKKAKNGKDDKNLSAWLSEDGGDDALASWLGGKEPPKSGDKPGSKDGGKKGDKGSKDKGFKAEVSGTDGKSSKKDMPKGKKDKIAADSDDKGTPPKQLNSKMNMEEKADALKMWLKGDAGGEALEEWLTEEDKSPDHGAKSVPEGSEQLKKELDEKTKALKEKENTVTDLQNQLNEMKKEFKKTFSKVNTGDFDPLRLLEETATLNKQLQTEIKKRKELEQEIEHVKKGSIAVIKYVKAQQMKIREDSLRDIKKKFKQGKQAVTRMEAEVQQKDKQINTLKEELSKKLEELPGEVKDYKEKELELQEKEAELEARRQELDVLSQNLKEQEQEASAGGGVDGEALRGRLEEELRERQQEFLDNEDGLKKNILDLEESLEKERIDRKMLQESLDRTGKSAPEVGKALEMKAQDLANKEKAILLREHEIDRLKTQLREKEDEMTKIKEPLAFKEDEINRREADMMYREELMKAEMAKLEKAQGKIGSLDQQKMKEELKRLEDEITRKEEEMRAREKYLSAKSEELRVREQGLIGEEIEAKGEERAIEIKIEKVKSGTPRLDDLLLGGIPFGSNVSVYGPAFVGKEVIMNAFIGEGLRKGVPAIWVITDKTPDDIREEMEFVLSGYHEYEKLGLVRYVDAYSMSMGEEGSDEYTSYVDEPTDTAGILKAVDIAAKELKDNIKEKMADEFQGKDPYYRLAFRSVSTIIAYLDSAQAFKFLQPFVGRRKRDKAVSMFAIERGMHSDTDIQMLGHIMTGSVELKVEQLKTFLAVKGICDVQSRAWVRYTFSKKSISIGSFALDHIR